MCGSGTCSTHELGATLGFDAVRTTSNRTYVGWTTVDITTHYNYATMCSPGLCHCVMTPSSSIGTATVVLARVESTGTTELLHGNRPKVAV